MFSFSHFYLVVQREREREILQLSQQHHFTPREKCSRLCSRFEFYFHPDFFFSNNEIALGMKNVQKKSRN